jgi:serine/threonine protein kinase
VPLLNPPQPTHSPPPPRRSDKGVQLTSEGSPQKSFSDVTLEDLMITETLGRGCSSFVQKAVHRATGAVYAVKVISLFDKSKRDQLIAEISALFDAKCLALISFHGSVFRDNKIHVVLEYMDLGSFDLVVARYGPIPEPVLAAMAYQMLWGLAYLKYEKRVHRDIKPQNILLNSEGRVKLTDFGISKAMGSVDMCSTFTGTFRYMSPERIQNHEYGFSADVWGLGLVLHELATGAFPFPESRSQIDMVQTLLEAERPRLPRGFSPSFQEFLDECLHKDPDERMTSDLLMGSPWLVEHAVGDLDEAVRKVRVWVDHVREGGGGGGGARRAAAPHGDGAARYSPLAEGKHDPSISRSAGGAGADDDLSSRRGK